MSRLNLIYNDSGIAFNTTMLHSHFNNETFRYSVFKDENDAFRYLACGREIQTVSVTFDGKYSNFFANFTILIQILIAVNKNKCVTGFIVHGCGLLNVTLEQAIEFAQLLGENKRLTEITLNCCGFCDEELTEIVLQSLKNKKLQFLQFCHNGVRSVKVNAMIGDIVRNSSTIGPNARCRRALTVQSPSHGVRWAGVHLRKPGRAPGHAPG